MPKSLSIFTNYCKEGSSISAAIILALVIIAAYSPVIFLGQSYNQAIPIPPEFLDYHGKSTLFATTGDRYGTYQGVWPDIKLAAELISEGQIPLWNPYIALGRPLAADAQSHIFSPITLGFLLPTQFWDFPLLVTLWVAGIFTFLFLRSLGLNFIPSIAGGIFYMLSGPFVSDLPHTYTAVMMFTPFILYSLEKLIQHRNLKHIVLTSIAFSFGILGAYPAPVILQFLLVGLYLFYRILYPVVSNYRKQTQVSGQTALLTHDTKRIISWSVLAFIGGLGLSAFFILPAYEYLQNLVLGHDANFALWNANTISILTIFVPYILGSLHAYWLGEHLPLGSWNHGGVFVLFFSIIGIWLSSKNKGNPHRYTPLFFFAVSIFFIMKLVGVPVVSWITYLPIFNLIYYIKSLGVIIPFGFAISAAFGIDMLTKLNVSKKTLGIIFIITISTILLLLIPLIPYLAPDAKFAPAITPTDARNYVGFQILQAVIFAIFAFLLSIAVSKNKSAILGIIPLVLLELSLYIPVGLHPVWMAFKAIIIIAGMAAITAVILRPNRLTWNLQTRNIKLYVIVGILIVTFAGIVMVSELSPFGMMKRYDSFQKDPVTDFLKENLGSSRMFSFDFTLGPTYPAGYKISTVGMLGAFSIDSFENFLLNFLDPQAPIDALGFYPWTYSYGPMGSIDKFFEHKKYFDFLGVKYILTQGYDFNTFAPGIPGQSGQYAKLSDNNISQSFISPVDSIKSIGISLGASQLQKQDNIILTLDSVPPDERYHRESFLNQTINQQYNQFQITPPLTDVSNKEFYLSLKYPQADVNKLAVVFTISENQTGYDIIKNELQGKFYENGIAVDGKQMAFSITSDSEKYPVAFRFHDIYLYENTDAFPRAFLVNKFHVVHEDKDKNLIRTLDTCPYDRASSCLGKARDFLMKNPDFDLRHEVILEEQLPAEWIDSLKSSTLDDNSATEIMAYSANKVVINTDSTDASLLVLTDSYYPGWKAHVDGKESKIYRADGLVRAIFVPAGTHTVEFSYMPQSFMTGVIISLITITLLSILFIYSKRKILRTNKNGL